jgi:hypothetical protein
MYAYIQYLKQFPQVTKKIGAEVFRAGVHKYTTIQAKRVLRLMFANLLK